MSEIEHNIGLNEEGELTLYSKRNGQIFASIFMLSIFIWAGIVHAQSDSPKMNIYDMGILNRQRFITKGGGQGS